MTKLAAAEKKLPEYPPTLTPDNPPTRWATSFFHHVLKVAGVTRKQLQYDLRVSKTLVDLWITGEKNDPFTQARRALSVFTEKGRGDLAVTILVYIAGGDQFDGQILTKEQTDALKTLAAALK